VASDLVRLIAHGTYPAGSRLPTEPELAAQAGVSRMTLREAIKALAAKGLVSVKHGRGTWVRPTSDWSPLDPDVLAARSAAESSGGHLADRVLEARRLVEVGLAELAAVRRTPSQLEVMDRAIEAMRAGDAASDIGAFVDADIAFHAQVIAAADNAIVAAFFAPIEGLIRAGRIETSGSAAGRARAVAAHRRILVAIRSSDPIAARTSMERHLDQTARDLVAAQRQRSTRRR
jgi:GntR family transcriptional regulator, transcriptional repressor for pyruvate dehydrogenase complex